MVNQADINRVTQYIQSGEDHQAERMCHCLLAVHPHHADALHYLGVIALQNGNPDRAADLIEQAIRIDSHPQPFIRESSLPAKDEPKCASSARRAHQVARLTPDCADAHYHMGLALYRQGKPVDALTCFHKALAVNPRDAQALYNIGCILRSQGDSQQAIEFFQKALEIDPDHLSAHNNLGASLHATGKIEDAIACFQKALKINPRLADVHINLGRAFREQGQVENAWHCFEKALAIQPDHAVAHYNMGVILYNRGSASEAIARFQKALALDPTFAEVYFSLGNVLSDCGTADEAIANYRRAIQLEPNHTEAYLNLGHVYQNIGKIHQAVMCFRKAIEIRPAFAEAHNNLGKALGELGLLAESLNSYRKALELKPDYTAAHSNLLFQMNYDPESTAKDMMGAATIWWQQHGQSVSRRFYHRPRPDRRRLRIGYVSADFCQHSVSHFFLPLLTAHNERNVEIYCYSDVRRPDEITRRIENRALNWRPIFGRTNEAVARQVFEDQIDILVDLSGHTAANRLLVFAGKPAPLQVTWLGYPGTTGLPFMDYRITDEIADPPGLADRCHSETLVRLPHGFLCYAPNWPTPSVAQLPSSVAGYITFGSFNNLSKVNPEVIAVWAQILLNVPDSCLMLKAKQLSDESVRRRYLDLFARNGIGSDRIKMAPTTQTIPEHMSRYNRVDIALDPFPYNGTTTTFEALYMGVPVVTLAGERHAARVGASILSHLGLPSLIAGTPDQYVRIATRLANDAKRLSGLRDSLRQQLLASSLGDSDGFARTMEEGYQNMWQDYCVASGQQTSKPINSTLNRDSVADSVNRRGATAQRGVLKKSDIQKRVDAFPYWYHKIQLPQGVVTPGWAPLNPDAYQIPGNLDGKRVLDVGAWDGYWTFEALKRGAREVLAIDDFSDYLGKLEPGQRCAWDTFDLCRDILGYAEDRCRRAEVSVYDLDESRHGRFDVIFFFGTLYHLRYPLLALDRLASICDGEIHVESAIVDDFSPYRGGFGSGYPGQMVMEFYPDNQYGNNHTNWWAPSLACLVHMLKAAGFSQCRGWKLMSHPKDLPGCRGFAHGRKEKEELPPSPPFS